MAVKAAKKKAKVKTSDQPVRLPPGVANPVDIHVGNRLRMRRTLLGMSQEKLGEEVGLTFQQIQKYERGANRIGASRLYDFAQILNVPVSYFFEDLDEGIASPEGAYEVGMRYHETSLPETDAMNRRETLELVRAYYKIPDPKKRQVLMDLFNSLAD